MIRHPGRYASSQEINAATWGEDDPSSTFKQRLALTLPSKGMTTSKQCQENVPHNITEPPHPFIVGNKHSGLNNYLGLRHMCTRLFVENMVEDDSSEHITILHCSVVHCLCSLHH